MELTLSLMNVGQLLTILHSVAFSLASNVSINMEVSAGLVDGELHAVSTPEGPTKDFHSSYIPPHVTLSHSISPPGEVNPVLHSKLTNLSIISSSVIEKFTGSPYLRDNSKTIYKLNVSAFYSASSYQSYQSFTKSVLSPTPVNQRKTFSSLVWLVSSNPTMDEAFQISLSSSQKQSPLSLKSPSAYDINMKPSSLFGRTISYPPRLSGGYTATFNMQSSFVQPTTVTLSSKSNQEGFIISSTSHKKCSNLKGSWIETSAISETKNSIEIPSERQNLYTTDAKLTSFTRTLQFPFTNFVSSTFHDSAFSYPLPSYSTTNTEVYPTYVRSLSTPITQTAQHRSFSQNKLNMSSYVSPISKLNKLSANLPSIAKMTASFGSYFQYLSSIKPQIKTTSLTNVRASSLTALTPITSSFGTVSVLKTNYLSSKPENVHFQTWIGTSKDTSSLSLCQTSSLNIRSKEFVPNISLSSISRSQDNINIHSLIYPKTNTASARSTMHRTVPTSNRLVIPRTDIHSLRPTPHMSMMAIEIPFIAGTDSHSVSTIPQSSFTSTDKLVSHRTDFHSLRPTPHKSMMATETPFVTGTDSHSASTIPQSSFTSSDKLVSHRTDFHSLRPTPHMTMMATEIPYIPGTDSNSVNFTPQTSLKSLDKHISYRTEVLRPTPQSSLFTTKSVSSLKSSTKPNFSRTDLHSTFKSTLHKLIRSSASGVDLMSENELLSSSTIPWSSSQRTDFHSSTYSHQTSVVSSIITFILKTGSPSRSTIATSPFKPSESIVLPNTLLHSLSSTLKPSVFTSGFPFFHEIQSLPLNTMTPSLFKSSQEAGLPSSSDFHSLTPSQQTSVVTSGVTLIPEIDLHSLSNTPSTSFTSLDMSFPSRTDFRSLMSTPFTSVGITEKPFVAKTGSLSMNTVPYTSVNTSNKESQPIMSPTYITGSPQTLEVPSGHTVMFTGQPETHFMTNAISQGFISSKKPFVMNPVSDVLTTVLHRSRNLSTNLHSVESIHKTSTATMITTSISKSQSYIVDILPKTSTNSYSSTLVNSLMFLNPSTNPAFSSQFLSASHVSHQPHLSGNSVSSSSVSSSHFTNILSKYFISVSAAFPDSTSEPVTMVTIRPTSTIGGSIAILSSFPSMTFLPSNSLSITLSNAGIVPTVILTSHSTSEVPPFRTSKLNLYPSTTLEPSFISSTSQSYATPRLPSTVTTSSTTSEELNEMSSSTSPPGTATSAVTVDNTTSAVTADNTTTTAVTVDNSISAVTVDNTTSAVTVDNTTSAVTVDNTTSAVTVDNTTSAVTVDNTTSAVTVDNTTSAVTVDNTTSAVTVDNTTSAVTVDNTTSVVTVDNTTSAVTVDNTTSAVTVDTTTMSSPVTMVSTNNPTLDKSFSTREYWVMMELSTPLDMDIQDGGFLKELELSLALSYSKAKEIEVEKDAEVKQLLQNLNPEEDILLRRRRKRRRRRASTIDGHTAQIIDLSRNAEIASSSELVFYIMSGGVNIPAVTCATTFSELSVQELTLLLGVVVLTPVNSYNAVPTTASPPADTNLVILLSILIPLAILSSCMCCCCMFCVICGPKKKENERTMAPDTFRMLEFKQKFPYKPYPPNQTPRDFKEQPSDDDVALGTEINLGGDFIEVDPTPRVFPDGDNNFNLESFQLPETIPKTNRGLEPSVTEPPVSSSQNELLDKPNHNRNVSDSEATMRNLPHLQPSSRSNSEYKKAQREISKILEPGNLSKPRKKRKKQEEQSSSQLTNEDEKFLRGPTKVSSDDTSETMSETKQRVHALIEEAFSLVNFSRAPPTTNVTHLNSQNDEKDNTEEERKTISEARHAADLLKGKKKEFGMQTMQAEEQRQVLIVPVNVPPTDGTSIIWSPYSARDELQRISPTREPASLPGGIERDESLIKLPATASRPSFPDGAEYSASFLGHEPPLDHSIQSHEYSALDTNNALNSPRRYHTADFVQIQDGEDTSDRGGSRNYENSQKYGDLNYLTELETERTQRSAGFYDELDVTANFRYGRKPYSSKLMESIKAELKNTTRRGGDGQ